MEATDIMYFILTYKRPDRQKTYGYLKKSGVSDNQIWMVVDDTDDTVEEYKKRFKNVYVFSKREVRPSVDLMDNLNRMNAVVYARNKIYDIAAELGAERFIMLDDDYSDIHYQIGANGERLTRQYSIKNLNEIVCVLFEFMDSVPSLKVLAIGQGGDLFSSSIIYKTKRKAMNMFFCRTDRRIVFRGTMNEDVNMYVDLGRRGELALTVFFVALCQEPTQLQRGGLTDLYLELGTYVKSMYPVMIAPTAVTVAPMGAKNLRLHHKIDYNKLCPKIIDEKYKKRSAEKQ